MVAFSAASQPTSPENALGSNRRPQVSCPLPAMSPRSAPRRCFRACSAFSATSASLRCWAPACLSDAYFAALQIPNLFRRLLAEGALNSAFVPMWLRIREKRGMPGTRGFAREGAGYHGGGARLDRDHLRRLRADGGATSGPRLPSGRRPLCFRRRFRTPLGPLYRDRRPGRGRGLDSQRRRPGRRSRVGARHLQRRVRRGGVAGHRARRQGVVLCRRGPFGRDRGRRPRPAASGRRRTDARDLPTAPHVPATIARGPLLLRQRPSPAWSPAAFRN